MGSAPDESKHDDNDELGEQEDDGTGDDAALVQAVGCGEEAVGQIGRNVGVVGSGGGEVVFKSAGLLLQLSVVLLLLLSLAIPEVSNQSIKVVDF